jgi:molecular chaperone IbpA
MATLDFTPLYHSTVGFDRLPMLLAQALDRDEGGYPPYNIEKISDDVYRIAVALAGFSKDDVEIVTENNRLSVRGAVKDKNGTNYLHHGIAQRSFQRVFDLADHIVVAGASMENGLLVIELKREVPEALKPRTIPIGDKPAAVSLKAVDKSAERNAA